jgi:apolipoprotein N-acyltransferase
MDTITGYISAHPAILLIGVVLFIVLFLHFTIKSLVKLVLIILFILLAIFGYYSFQDQDTMSDKTKESTDIIQSVMDDLKAKSKSFFTDSKDLYNKSKDAPKEVDKLLDTSDKELEKDFKKK